MNNDNLFLGNNIHLWNCQKAWWEKRKEDEQTLAELSSVHRFLQAKCQQVQTSYIKRIKLTELCLSVWENLDLGSLYTPHCVRSVLTISVKINYLLTQSEVVTGKFQTEALPYWPSDKEVNTVFRGRRFSRNDRTVEVIKSPCP